MARWSNLSKSRPTGEVNRFMEGKANCEGTINIPWPVSQGYLQLSGRRPPSSTEDSNLHPLSSKGSLPGDRIVHGR